MNSAIAAKPKLILRTAGISDAAEMAALSRQVYGDAQGSTEDALKGQINQFPEGQFIAEYEGRIVGFCSTFIISSDLALKPHSWMEITGGGFASRHDPDGDVLYGMEVTVDPSRRRLRIGQRLYRLRRELCQEWELKGIVIGGRMPGYHRAAKDYPNPEDYLKAVADKKVRDPVVNFQLSQGFEILGVLPHYAAEDKESKDFAVLMMWRNPLAPEESAAKAVRPGSRLPDSVRVAAVQFEMRRISRIEDFEEQVEFFVDTAARSPTIATVFARLWKSWPSPTTSTSSAERTRQSRAMAMSGTPVSSSCATDPSMFRKSFIRHLPKRNGGTSRAAKAPR